MEGEALLAIFERSKKKHQCACCGKNFIGARDTENDCVVFCSDKCKKQFKENPVLAHNCDYCGKPFNKRKPQNINKKIRFCNAKCYKKFLQKGNCK